MPLQRCASYLAFCVQVTAFNEPPPKAVYFDTPFGGRFGMMTCYDIEFKEPASLLLAAGVTNILCAFRVSCAPWPIVHRVTPDRDSARLTWTVGHRRSGLGDIASTD